MQTSNMPVPVGRSYSPTLVMALALAGIVSLSIHVIMLQVLGVPFPEEDAPAWAGFLNLAGTTTALICVQLLARDRLGGFWRTAMLSGLILFMIKEGLRGAVMNGVVTGGWIFALAGALVPMLLSFGIALACTMAAGRVRSVRGLLLAAALTGLFAVLLQLAVGAAMSPIMGALASFARPDAYQLPYPPAVLVPAYLTFAEPVLGCAILAALIWNSLKGSVPARVAQFTLVVVFIKGVVVRTLLYPAFMAQAFGWGMLSQSQFLFEFATLGALTAITWHYFGPGQSDRRRGPRAVRKPKTPPQP